MAHERSHEQEEAGRFIVLRLVVSAGLFIAALFVPGGPGKLLLCLAAYVPVAADVLKEAVENILHGEIFDENFLMAVASIGAFGIGEYPEAVAVMWLYTVGELLQDKAVDSSRASIEALTHVRPDTALVLRGEEWICVPAASVAVGEIISVRPGDRVALDGIIRRGTAFADTSALTGESLPRRWTVGDMALAGCVDQDGVLEIEVTRPFTDSGVSRIMALVGEAQERKAAPEKFITRFARVYTPIVCLLALLVGALPPLLGWGAWTEWIHRALAFLVISCPCALVISVPLTVFAGMGCAGRHGILVKGGNYLELLSRTRQAAFDKTGTLTEGRFQVKQLIPADGVSKERLLEVAAACEQNSTHPLAKAIAAACPTVLSADRIQDVQEISGYGIRAVLDGREALAGRKELLGEGIDTPEADGDGTVMYVAWDHNYLGRILFADTVKKDAGESVAQLRDLDFKALVMLSGDRRSAVDPIAAELGLDHALSELLPEDKVAAVKELQQRGSVLYAGDGINDAPVLVAADVGIAMGALGSDAAMEAADVVIMNDAPCQIPLAVQIARKTMRLAWENIILTVAAKVLILLLSLFFDPGLWLAVAADVGVCLLAVLNSLRAMKR